MKTSEFIKFFEDEGYIVYKGDVIISVDDKSRNELFDISEKNSVATDYIAFDNLPFEIQQKYYKVIFDYLMTPIEDRKEEEKYYYKLKGFGEEGYLNQEVSDIYLSDSSQIIDCQTQFTDKEFEAFPDDIKSHNWEKIKVERGE